MSTVLVSHLMAGVAQLVRARVCGTRGRGFKTRRSPHLLKFFIFAISPDMGAALERLSIAA